MVKKALVGGQVLVQSGRLADYTVVMENNHIKDLLPAQELIADDIEKIDVNNLIVAPGFIDTHVHGGLGRNFMEGTPEAISAISKYLVTGGVTSCLATTTSASFEDLRNALHNACNIYQNPSKDEVQILGIHLEGPYVNPKFRGSHAEKYIRKPSWEELRKLYEAADGALKIVTLAPEIDGGMDAVKYFTEHGVQVSIGHTAASYSETKAAIDLGAIRGTHVFNAMPSIHHREPGPVTALLENPDIFIELTVDGHHIVPPVVGMALNLIGLERCVLITDGADVCGQGDGSYTRWEGTHVIVEQGIAKTLSGTLAGSTLQLNRAVWNLVSILGVPLEKALKMASENPARSIGVFDRKGSIVPGKDADIVVLNKDLSVSMTIVRGEIVYNRGKNNENCISSC